MRDAPYLTTRRGILAAGGVSLLSSLSGCGDKQKSAKSEQTDYRSLPIPSADTLDGVWEGTDTAEVTQEVKKGGIEFGTAYGTTHIFNHIPAQKRVRTKTKGEFSQPVGFAFATKLKLDGKALEYVPSRVLMGSVEDEFLGRLKDRGIRGISERTLGEVEFSPNHGGKVATKGFTGVYTVGPFAIPVELQNGQTRTFYFSQYQLTLETFIAVWKGDDAVIYSAGGGWPAEPYSEQTNWVSVTGSGSGDGADIKLRVRLPLSRSEIKSDVIQLAESVN